MPRPDAAVRQRSTGGLLCRREHPGPAVEQIGLRRGRAGPLPAGERVAADKPANVAAEKMHVSQNLRLDRSNVTKRRLQITTLEGHSGCCGLPRWCADDDDGRGLVREARLAGAEVRRQPERARVQVLKVHAPPSPAQRQPHRRTDQPGTHDEGSVGTCPGTAPSAWVTGPGPAEAPRLP